MNDIAWPAGVDSQSRDTYNKHHHHNHNDDKINYHNSSNTRINVAWPAGVDSQSSGILMSIGDFPEMLSQQLLVGIILVGRLGVC